MPRVFGRQLDRASLTSRGVSESYLGSRVHSDAPRTATTGHHVWSEEPHPLWGRLSPASVPVPHRIQGLGCSVRLAHPTEPSLQRRGDVAGAALPDDPRTGTPRDDAVAPPERGLSVPHRLAELSRCHDAPPVPPAGRPDGPPETSGPARSLPAAHDRPAAGPPPTDLRRGLHRVGRLRRPGAGSDRLQSPEAEPPVVPTLALLRGAVQGLLARRVAAWRCPYRQRHSRSPLGMLCEDPDRGPINDHPRGQRVLRSQAGRMARSPARPLRDRRPPDTADQAQAPAPAVRQPQPGRRGGPVSLPADPLAPSVPLRGDPPASTRRADRATDALQARAVPLPGARHEPAAAAAQPLAILQRPGERGVAHPAAQGGLRPRQYSHPSLLRQRDLLPSALARVQPRELVQAPMLAAGVAGRDPADPATTHPSLAGPTASHRQPSAPVLAGERPSRGGLDACPRPDPAAQPLTITFFTPDSG